MPYFFALKHGRGSLRQVIPAGLINLKNQTTSFATLYLFSDSVLLYLNASGDKPRQLSKLESTDKLAVVSAQVALIQDAYKANPDFASHAFEIRTTNPLNYLALNNHFLLIPGITPFGIHKKRYKKPVTIYVVGQEYPQEVNNLTQAIKASITQAHTNVAAPLPGMSATTAQFTMYAQVLVVIVLAILIPLALLNQPNLIIPFAFFLVVYYLLFHVV